MLPKSHVVVLVAAVCLSLQPVNLVSEAGQQTQKPAPQAQGPFEPVITRIRNSLTLSDDQAAQLRQILVKHAQKINQLRGRFDSQPYLPQLQADVEAEQAAIRDELNPLLNDDQKAKVATTDFRPIPQPPGFILIDLPPRAESQPLPVMDRVMPAVSPAGKGRAQQLTEDQKVLHLLNRITFGPRPGDVERMKQMGVAAYLDQQLHPETIDDSVLEKRLAVLPTQQMTSAELNQFYPQPNVAMERAKDKNAPAVLGRPQQIVIELLQQKLVRATDSDRQLQELMTDFWFNHFNVFAQKDADLYFLTSYERDVIRPNALGKFRDLLLAVAQSPAMLYYLDNWLSVAPDSKRPSPPPPLRPAAPQPTKPQQTAKPALLAAANASPGALAKTAKDEGRGEAAPQPAVDQKSETQNQKQADQKPGDQKAVDQKPVDQAKPAPPKPAAPPARKPGINENYARELMELHTMGVDGGYTQKDVQEVARCFTGWTIDRPALNASFVFRPWTHDTGSKTVLGVTIPAGGGIGDGERVIDILSRHPSTARFVSKKLCQRFVSDNPPPKLFERVARVFLSTDGDIREVVRAILTSPEFNSPAAFRSKVKSPLELAASALRALDGDTNGAPTIQDWLRRTGEPLYQYQFPTGYGEDSSRWVNTGVFMNRLNFLVAIANNQVPGTSYDPTRLAPSETAGDIDRLTDRLAALIVHTGLSADSRRAIQVGLSDQGGSRPAAGATGMQALAAARPAGAIPASFDRDAARRRIAQIVELLFATAEFQRK